MARTRYRRGEFRGVSAVRFRGLAIDDRMATSHMVAEAASVFSLTSATTSPTAGAISPSPMIWAAQGRIEDDRPGPIWRDTGGHIPQHAFTAASSHSAEQRSFFF